MAKTRTWYEAAEYCEETFGSYVDYSEGFFICPECAEPVYECDWDDHPDWRMCPICEINWEDIE